MATTMTTPEKNSKKSGNKLLHRTVTICVMPCFRLEGFRGRSNRCKAPEQTGISADLVRCGE